MIISHVKIIAFQTIINHSFWIFYIGRKDSSLYNKQKNTWVLGNTRFTSRVEPDISHSIYQVQHSKKFWYFQAPMDVLFSI